MIDEKELQRLETAWITESIIKLHKEKGVSLSFIARNTGLSQTSITKILQEKKRRMRPENREALISFICKTFGFKRPSFNNTSIVDGKLFEEESKRNDGAVALNVSDTFDDEEDNGFF